MIDGEARCRDRELDTGNGEVQGFDVGWIDW
jgi:hypothetical protein